MDVRPRKRRDRQELRRRVAGERDARQRDRYRMVLLALEGLTAVEIAERVGCSRRTVQQWVYRYRDQGLDGLRVRPRPGRPRKLAPQQEGAFRKRLEAGPRPDDGVCTLRGRDIQRILEQEFGVQYSLQGVYDLLHRLGYACLKPRPRHRKNDPQAMALWRAEAPLLSGGSAADTVARRCRSGSRTKRGSASRAR